MSTVTVWHRGEPEDVDKVTYEDWQYEIANGDTILGLMDWMSVRQGWRTNDDHH